MLDAVEVACLRLPSAADIGEVVRLAQQRGTAVVIAGDIELAARLGQFDVVHDNQTFGSGMLGIMADGWPLLGTCHHPITVDRTLDLEHAETWRRQITLRRWYGFLRGPIAGRRCG